MDKGIIERAWRTVYYRPETKKMYNSLWGHKSRTRKKYFITVDEPINVFNSSVVKVTIIEYLYSGNVQTVSDPFNTELKMNKLYFVESANQHHDNDI